MKKTIGIVVAGVVAGVTGVGLAIKHFTAKPKTLKESKPSKETRKMQKKFEKFEKECKKNQSNAQEALRMMTELQKQIDDLNGVDPMTIDTTIADVVPVEV